MSIMHLTAILEALRPGIPNRQAPTLRPLLRAVLPVCGAALLLGASTGGLPQGQGLAWRALNRGLLPHVTITALAVDPRAVQRIYAGTDGPGGLWISDDGGSAGHFAGGALAARVVYSLLIDRARPDQIMAGTDAGLYRSTDAGETWQRDSGLPAAAIFGLASGAGGALLAGGAGPSVYRHAAGQGAVWQKLAPLPGSTAVLSLAASARGSLILAGTDGGGLFRSRDAGRTWDRVPEIGPTYVAALAFAAGDGWAAVARTRKGVYGTNDGGQSWHPLAPDVPGRVDALAIFEQGDIYLGTSEGALYRGGFRTGWHRWGMGIGMPGLFSAVVAAPGAPAHWYAGTASGLYSSNDAGLSWRPAQPGPGRPAATALAMAADASLYLGNGDGVFRSRDGGQQWDPCSAGLPPDTVLALAPAAGNPGLIYAGLAGRGLYFSQDGGLHWEATGWTNHGAPAVLVDPEDPRHLFIRVTYERVYESRDGGQTWGARWEGLGLATQIIALAGDPRRRGTLYAGGTEGFFRSEDGAAHWQSAGPELAGQTIFAIAADPWDARILYAGATLGAYRSEDGGEHWQRWGHGLEDVTVTELAYAHHDARLVLAGTKYRGVFTSQDGGQTWQYAGPDMVSVNGLLVGPDDGWIYAATANGFYAMPVAKR